jgi:Cu+-exporting ATPase
MDTQDGIITTILIDNLHCPSCVTTVNQILNELSPRPSHISASIVNNTVVVKHPPALESKAITQRLVDAGFEIQSVSFTEQESEDSDDDAVHNNTTAVSGLTRWISRSISHSHQQKTHHEYCDACAGHQTPPEEDFRVVIESTGPVTKRAKLAVSGMTCSSCVNAITEALERTEWIKKVTVNLISNSATVEFTEPGNAEKLVEAIEDLGYDAIVDSILDLSIKTRQQKPNTTIRSVKIKIDGIHCSKCPGRILEALEDFGEKIKILKEPSLDKPTLELSYTPSPPSFTIRQVISNLNNIEETLRASIYHPPTLEEQSQKLYRRHLRSLIWRLILTAVIAIPTFILGIVYMTLVPSSDSGWKYLMSPLSKWSGMVTRLNFALFVLSTPIYLFAADVFHRRATKEIIIMWKPGSRTPILHRFLRFGSMDMLTSLGTSIAYFSSLSVLILDACRTREKGVSMSSSDTYFDSVVFLTLFLLMGRLLEAYSKSRAGNAVTALGKLQPKDALLVSTTPPANGDHATGKKLSKISVDMIEIGDMLQVVSGKSPPCDGVVTQGSSKFDESSLTGESRLIQKDLGDEVYTGTINDGSPITIQAMRIAGSSMLDQVVSAVREGQTRRAPIERFADLITSYFVPVITYLAIAIWVIWLTLGLSGTLPSEYLDTPVGGWSFWSLQFAIAVFVVACPCGVGLAAPTALYVGGGLAAKHGILVKGGGQAFQEASEIDIIVFDKTGTLTKGGEPAITNELILDTNGALTEPVALYSMMRTLEESSSHPIAKAVVAFAESKGAESLHSSKVDEIPGKGMKGLVAFGKQDYEVLLGNEALINDYRVYVSNSSTSTLDGWKAEGKSVALLAIKKKGQTQSSWALGAILAASDPIRPEAKDIIRKLQNRGVDVWMLSGDNQITANSVGTSLGIFPTNIIAGALPSQKADKIRYLQKSQFKKSPSRLSRLRRWVLGTKEGEIELHKRPRRAIVAMVGDGINDSPALTAADVGIAIGSGSDIAISSAEFVLITAYLSTILTLIDLSRVVFRRVKLNFAWALVYNILAVPFAGGAFYAFKTSHGTHLRLDPVWASLAMALSSVSVVSSSLLLRSRIFGFKASSTTDSST